jgi:hypothetical protein
MKSIDSAAGGAIPDRGPLSRLAAEDVKGLRALLHTLEKEFARSYIGPRTTATQWIRLAGRQSLAADLRQSFEQYDREQSLIDA